MNANLNSKFDQGNTEDQGISYEPPPNYNEIVNETGR